MSLHNIIMNGVRGKCLIAAGMLMSTLPVQASVIYEFTTAPISAGVELFRTTGESAVQTVRTGYFEFGPLPVGVPQTASLTFASPLAPSSVIPISAESGGYDFVGRPNEGGLEAYSALVFERQITSNIDEYFIRPLGGWLYYDGYSALEGEVTTDASRNIVNWDLRFHLYNSNFQIHPEGAIEPLPVFHTDSDWLVEISSNPASPQTITNVVRLNGVDNTDNFSFNRADTVFIGGGPDVHYTYYTDQLGSVVLVPEPETYAMLLAGLGLIGFMARRKNALRGLGSQGVV